MHKSWIFCLMLAGMLITLPGASCMPAGVLSGGGPTADDGNSVGSSSGSGTTNVDPSFGSQVIDLVNVERQAEGLGLLVGNDLLTEAAQKYAQKMADEGFFAHQDPNTGQMPWDRATAVGYQWTMIGENIAEGQTSPEMVMEGWMNSKGHRENILRPEFKEIGIGIYRDLLGRIYWVQLFGTPG